MRQAFEVKHEPGTRDGKNPVQVLPSKMLWDKMLQFGLNFSLFAFYFLFFGAAA